MIVIFDNGNIEVAIAGTVIIVIIIGFIIVRWKEKREEKFDKRKW